MLHSDETPDASGDGADQRSQAGGDMSIEFGVRRKAVAACVSAALALGASAADLLVDTLADDLFPDETGAVFDAAGNPVVLAAPKCTFRMAVAASNLDLAVGGANGCVAQPSTSFVPGGPDRIAFAPALAGGVVNLNNTKATVPATGLPQSSMLWISGPVRIDGTVGGGRITLDGGATPTTNRRIMRISRVPAAGANLDGSGNWVSIVGINFRNSRIEASAGCVFAFENIRLQSVDFSNCESFTGLGGGAIAVIPFNGQDTTFRPDVTLENVVFRGNRASTSAGTTQGGAFVFGAGGQRIGHVVMSNVVVGGASPSDGNVAQGFNGGGRIVSAETVTIDGSMFRNNVAQAGEVGGLRIEATAGPINISNTTFLENRASSASTSGPQPNVGALQLLNNASQAINLQKVGILNNQARQRGGLHVLGNSGRIVLRDVVLSGNEATEFAGGAEFNANTGPGVLIADSKIEGNRVTAGSAGGVAVLNNAAPVRFERVRLNQNAVSKGTAAYASSGGGNLYNNVEVTFVDSEIADNTSDFHIGALSVSASFTPFDPVTGLPVSTLPPTTQQVTFERTSITGNTTTAPGGNGFSVIYITTPGIYRFVNSTVAGNSATGCGGGVTVDAFNPSSQTNASQIIIRNTTIARNAGACDEGLGVVAFNPATPSTPGAVNGSVTIESSIIGGQPFPATTSVINAVAGTPFNVANSLLERGVGPAAAGACGSGGVICNVDAKLGALALNGGYGKTLALLGGSPAIGTGSNSTMLTVDQRLGARLQGAAVDMGALEMNVGGGNCTLDMDGIGGVQANKEGLILVRSMLGFSDADAVVGTGITAAQWTAVKNNLNAQCGTMGSFAP